MTSASDKCKRGNLWGDGAILLNLNDVLLAGGKVGMRMSWSRDRADTIDGRVEK